MAMILQFIFRYELVVLSFAAIYVASRYMLVRNVGDIDDIIVALTITQGVLLFVTVHHDICWPLFKYVFDALLYQLLEVEATWATLDYKDEPVATLAGGGDVEHTEEAQATRRKATKKNQYVNPLDYETRPRRIKRKLKSVPTNRQDLPTYPTKGSSTPMQMNLFPDGRSPKPLKPTSTKQRERPIYHNPACQISTGGILSANGYLSTPAPPAYSGIWENALTARERDPTAYDEHLPGYEIERDAESTLSTKRLGFSEIMVTMDYPPNPSPRLGPSHYELFSRRLLRSHPAYRSSLDRSFDKGPEPILQK